MKEQHPIDDLFKDRLGDFSLEAPMHLFDQVAAAAQVEDPKSKRKGLWFLWILLPLFLIGTATFAYFSFQSTPNNSKQTLSYFPIELEGENANNITDATLPTVAKGTSSQEDTDNNLRETPSASIAAPIEDIKAGGEIVKEKIFKAENTQENKQTKALGNPNLGAKKEVAESKAKIIAAADASSNTQSSANPLVPIREKEADSAPPQANATLDLMGPLDLLTSEALLLENPLRDEELPIIGFGKKNWITTLDFMASMDFVMRQLEAKEDEFNAYARLRNNTETFRHGTSFGMRLSTVSETGFAVRSGLNYSTINEQLNYKIKEEELQTITTRFGADGSVIGSDTSITLVGTYRITNNRYTELDIPLLVGYEFIGQKASFSLNGGVLINMLSAQKGEFVSPNTNDAVSFSSNDPNSYRAFRNRLGIGFYGSMGIYFQFKDNMQVLFEPYVKYRPGSVTVDAYVLDQRYLTAGLFVGLRKRIL